MVFLRDGKKAMKKIYPGRPVINLGHRGAPEAAPENTISSFLAAVAMGAHGIELDVRMSKDKEPVVIHNTTVDKTTDGTGKVKDFTLAGLKQLDAGSWFGEEFTGERIPTLREVVEALDPSVYINIEIKNMLPPGTGGIEEAVMEVISEYDLCDRVIISSFNPLSLLTVKRFNKKIPVALLLYIANLPVIFSMLWLISMVKPEALHPHFQMVDETYLEWARNKGYRVNVWTVNEEADLRRMIKLGVHGIITDRPGLLKEIMEGCGSPNMPHLKGS